MSASVAHVQPESAAAPRYDFAVTLLPERRRLEGDGTLWLPASDSDRQDMQLVLTKSMEDMVVEVLEPHVSRGRPTVQRRERPGPTAAWASVVSTISPDSPFPVGEPILLRLSWSGGGQPGFVFHLGPDASFGGGNNTPWYPQLLDATGSATPAIGRLTFHAPDGYSVIASGTPEHEPSRAGGVCFVVEQPMLFSFAAARYVVLRAEGPVSMSLYLLRHRPDAQRYLHGCARILEVLVREYGAHPYGNHFAVVEVPTEALEGSSGASFEHFIFSNSASLDAPFNPVFYAHEIGHIWWGNLIKRRGARGRTMLDEGMAQYSALIALEELEGPAAAERFRRRGDPASPIEHSASTYFALVAAGLDHPLSALPNDWNAKNLANTKGAFVMDLLARTIGKARFRQILQTFTHAFAFQRVRWDDFVDAFRRGTEGQADWFFEQWFDRTGAPEWRLKWEQDGYLLRGVVMQDAPFFQALVDVEVTDTAGRRTVRPLQIGAQARTVFEWTVDSTAAGVALDPGFGVLRWTPEYRAEAPLLAPYWQAFAKEESGRHEEALADLEAALRRVAEPDTVGARFMLEELTARLNAGDPARMADAKMHLERALMSASRRTERLGWAYFLLGYVAKALGDQATLELAIQGAATADALTGSWSGWGAATRALRRGA